MKTIVKILGSILLIIILVFGGGIFYLTRGLNEDVKLNGIDLSNLNDGTYKGIYNAGRWTNELLITIREGKITEIEIEDDVTFALPGVSNKLFNKVITSQNTLVDAVSGATVTSKAYLKSIENALTKNKNKNMGVNEWIL